MNKFSDKIKLTPREHGGGVKNKIVLSIVMILTLIVLLGGTYAIFARIDEANVANNYKTGNLHIIIDDTSEGLGGSLNIPSIPLSDEEGSALEPYKFKVVNKGNLYYRFDLKLLSDLLTIESDNCIDKQIQLNYIKVKINDEEPQLLSELEDSIILSQLLLFPGQKQYHELRVWLDENAPNSIIGSHFHGKVAVDGKAIYVGNLVQEFVYTGNYQEYVANENGYYEIQL